MANIEVDRPFLRFGDDGKLEAFDDQGRKIEPDKRDLCDILAEEPCKSMELESISIIAVRGSCYRLVYVPGVGYVKIPC